MASEPLLETVAQHESALMKGLDRAREEARRLVEVAHDAGATLLQESNARLDEEIAKRRREAAQARELERGNIQRASADKVEKIRSTSASRTASVRDELVARILPDFD